MTPAIKVVKAGDAKLSAADYTVAYKNAKGKTIKASAIKNAGKYTVVVTGRGDFTGSKSATFTVKKAANKVTCKSMAKTVKKSKLKKKARSLALPAVSKFGKATWTVVAKDKKGVLGLNAKARKITVKKGARAATYTMKLKATVKGTSNYKGATVKKFKVKVTVK